MTKKYSNPDCEDYNLGFKDGKAQAKKEILKKIDKLTKIKYGKLENKLWCFYCNQLLKK